MFVSVEVRSGDVSAPAGTRRWAGPHGLTGVLASEEPVGYDADRAADADADAAGWTGDAAAGTPWSRVTGGGDVTSTPVDDGQDTAFDTETVDGNGLCDGEIGAGGHGDAGTNGDGAGGWAVGAAPRSVEARTRLVRCATTPGSPLGAAVGALADAVGALSATATVDMAGGAGPADPADTVDRAEPAGSAALAGAGAGDGVEGGCVDGVGLGAEHVDVVGDALVAVAHLRARLDACELALLADFDRRGGYRADGSVTASSWLAGRTGTDYSATARQAATARRLGALPRLGAHLAAGDITLAHVTAVTDRCVPARAEAFAAAEAILAGLAASNPPRHVRHAVRRLVELDDPDGADPAPDAPGGDALRALRLTAGFQGRGQLDATLDPLTREALTVLLDAFDTPDPAGTPAGQRRTPTQRRHDAFAAMLHTLLAQPGLPTVQGARPQILITIDLAALLGLPPDHPAAAITLADLAACLGIDLPGLTDTPHHPNPDADPAHGPASDPDPDHGDDPDVADGPAGDPDPDHGDDPDPDVTTHAAQPPGEPAADPADGPDRDTTASAAQPEHEPAADPADADRHPTGATADHPTGPASTDPDPPRTPPPRPPRFGSGVALSPDAVRGLVPAATIMAVLTLGPWRAVNVGAKHRTLPAWLRTVLIAFHRHCRGPTCDRPGAWTEAHHITPWATAKTTDLNDSLPFCPPHHDLTEDGWHATLDHTTGTVTWTSPTGRTITVPPPDPWP